MYNLSRTNIDSNRGRSMFINAHKELETYLKNENLTKAFFSYFDRQCLTDEHFKSKLEPNGGTEENVFQCMKDCDSWRIDDKREFARIMSKSKSVPKSYLNFDDFSKEKHLYEDDKIWFIKSRGGTSGKGVYCKFNKELNENPGPQYIIQEEINNIDLWDDKKYVIRSYILIWNKRVFFHKKALAFIHGQKYETKTTSHDVQVSHAGYASPNGAVKVKSLEKIGELKNKRRDLYPHLQELLYNTSKVICDNFKNMIEKSTNRRYLILGTDYLPIFENEKYSLKIVEVNRYPNISHTNEVNRDVNERMIRDMIATMLEIDHPLGNDFVPIKI